MWRFLFLDVALFGILENRMNRWDSGHFQRTTNDSVAFAEFGEMFLKGSRDRFTAFEGVSR